MAGLVPAIHVFFAGLKGVDARDKRGHDELCACRAPHPLAELVIRPATSGGIRWQSDLFPHARRGKRNCDPWIATQVAIKPYRIAAAILPPSTVVTSAVVFNSSA
jgi:hypothetical protein